MHICCTVLFTSSSYQLLKTVTLLDPSLPSVARVTTGFLFFMAKRKRKEREEEGLSDETFTQFPLSQKWERKKTNEMRKEENKNKCNRDLTRSIEKRNPAHAKRWFLTTSILHDSQGSFVDKTGTSTSRFTWTLWKRKRLYSDREVYWDGRGWNSWLLKPRRYTVCLLLFSSC